MRGLPEYRIRAADSISPPLASGSVSGSVSTRILPSALGPRGPPGFWMLDPGICGRLGCVEGSGLCGGLRPPWNLDLGICGRLGWVCVRAPGFCMLESVWAVWAGVGRPDSVFWILETGLSDGRRGVGRPDSVFCILETGLSEGGSTGVGRPDSGFWILETGAVEGGRAVRILYSAFCILPATCACDAYAWEQRWHMSGCWILDSGNWAVGGTEGVWRPPGFCILYSVFCRPHMHVMHIHVSGGRNDGGVWAARILYSVFCILPAAYARPHVHVMHIHVSGGRRGVAAKRKSQTCSQAASNLRVFAHQHIGGQEIANGTLD